MVCKIGLLGLGTVGTGVVQILRSTQLRHPLLHTVKVHQIGVKSLDKPRDIDLTGEKVTSDLQAIVQDPEVDLIVELLGGLEPARSLILSAIAHHKHVVTANKAVIARYGQEIFRAAEEAGVYVLLEGAVCGGIPVIQTLRQALAGNYLRRILGIINGTTNFILSQMSTRQMSFADALSLAQSYGYAEADPSADVDGWDAADKISILASIAFGAQVNREIIPCDGIRTVTATDIRYAQEWGYVIKLLAVAERLEHPERLDIRVHPTLIPHTHPLASVNQVDNAVLVQGDPIGQVMLFGPGAGRGPTASAVVGDILSIVANLQMVSQVPNPLLSAHATSPFPLQPTSTLESEFYIRLLATDAPGVIGAIGTCFGECQVSLECIIQKASHETQAEIVVLTHRVREDHLREAVVKIEQLAMVAVVAAVFRVLPKTGSES